MAEGTQTDAEVIVVGAGHNGLICAAYLARAGIDTLLVESRCDVGGCASTVSDLGARFNICNCDHTLIRAMPVIDELDLASHGLTYLEPEASLIGSFHDRTEPVVFFHNVDRQLDAIASSHPHQLDGYRRYLDDALPVAELVLEMARTIPTTPRLLAGLLRRRSRGASTLLNWSRRSVTDVLADYFDDWHLAMPAVSVGPTVWGAPPDAPGTGLAALSYATRHLVKTGRPRGGSGALTESIRSSFEAAGGAVRCSSPVRELVVDDGRVSGVRLVDETRLTADAVVAACDPHRVFLDWLGETPPAARRLVRKLHTQPVRDGYESKIDAVLSDVPRYRIADRIHRYEPGLDLAGPTTVVSPSPEQVAEAHRLRSEGTVAPCPTLLLNVPSMLDPDMQSGSGEHVLSLEVLYTPYAHPGGWPDSSEPQRWLGIWSDLAEPPGSDLVTAWRAMTPDRYEAEFSMHRGHTPSFAASPLAALVGRHRSMTRYRTPIVGLYLCGAGTFPGAGIFGASGRNAAAAVQRDRRGAIGRRVQPIRSQLAAGRDRVQVVASRSPTTS